MKASLRRPRRPSVEDILISILTELLFSGSSLPFRVRWYPSRIIPPTYAQKHSKLMITMLRTRRVTRFSSHCLFTHALIGRPQSQTMSDSLPPDSFYAAELTRAVRTLSASSRNSSLTHPLTIISDMSAPPATRRNSWRVYERDETGNPLLYLTTVARLLALSLWCCCCCCCHSHCCTSFRNESILDGMFCHRNDH